VTDQVDRFAAGYADALAAAAGGTSEAALQQAYELGRRAIAEELSILDIAGVHHEALAGLLRDAGGDPGAVAGLAAASREVLVETLASFEMTQRGAREAHEIARAQEAHARQLRGLADAAVAINATRSLHAMLDIVVDRACAIVGARHARVVLHLGLEEPLLVSNGAPAGAGAAGLRAPLRGRGGEPLGQIHLAGKRAGAFTDNDEAILVQLAEMASVAIENARLYEREHAIAQTLQRSFLPARLPTVPGADVASRYRPAGEGIEVGGDFYDVFHVDGDRWALVIGDVCGKGAPAAAVTALARYTVRAAALTVRRPSDILRVVNEAILRQSGSPRHCTVACGILDLGRRPAALELSLGGHAPPLVLGPDGIVREVGEIGTLLGVVSDPGLHDDRVAVETGERIVLYTDGVTDAAAPDRAWAAGDVARVLAGLAGADADAGAGAGTLAGGLEAAVLEVAPRPRDDIAILVAAVLEP